MHSRLLSLVLLATLSTLTMSAPIGVTPRDTIVHHHDKSGKENANPELEACIAHEIEALHRGLCPFG
ncbi:hypothetical protein V8F06_011089 [Rhypophila decipiens]